MAIFAATAVAMVVCGILSQIYGSWILWLWFVGAISIFAYRAYGNSPMTYMFVVVALVWVYILEFMDLVYGGR